jgi:hypothetical protein
MEGSKVYRSALGARRSALGVFSEEQSMSKRNNVNPGQYKVSGRERPNTIAEERLKATKSEALRKSTKPNPKNKPSKQR